MENLPNINTVLKIVINASVVNQKTFLDTFGGTIKDEINRHNRQVEDDLKNRFLCPLSKKLLVEPVLLISEGTTCSKLELQKVLAEGKLPSGKELTTNVEDEKIIPADSISQELDKFMERFSTDSKQLLEVSFSFFRLDGTKNKHTEEIKKEVVDLFVLVKMFPSNDELFSLEEKFYEFHSQDEEKLYEIRKTTLKSMIKQEEILIEQLLDFYTQKIDSFEGQEEEKGEILSEIVQRGDKISIEGVKMLCEIYKKKEGGASKAEKIIKNIINRKEEVDVDLLILYFDLLTRERVLEVLEEEKYLEKVKNDDDLMKLLEFCVKIDPQNRGRFSEMILHLYFKNDDKKFSKNLEDVGISPMQIAVFSFRRAKKLRERVESIPKKSDETVLPQFDKTPKYDEMVKSLQVLRKQEEEHAKQLNELLVRYTTLDGDYRKLKNTHSSLKEELNGKNVLVKEMKNMMRQLSEKTETNRRELKRLKNEYEIHVVAEPEKTKKEKTGGRRTTKRGRKGGQQDSDEDKYAREYYANSQPPEEPNRGGGGGGFRGGGYHRRGGGGVQRGGGGGGRRRRGRGDKSRGRYGGGNNQPSTKRKKESKMGDLDEDDIFSELEQEERGCLKDISESDRNFLMKGLDETVIKTVVTVKSIPSGVEKANVIDFFSDHLKLKRGDILKVEMSEGTHFKFGHIVLKDLEVTKKAILLDRCGRKMNGVELDIYPTPTNTAQGFKVFITGARANYSARELKKQFFSCGLIYDVFNNKSEKFYAIRFVTEEGMRNCIKFNGQEIDGRKVTIRKSNLMLDEIPDQ